MVDPLNAGSLYENTFLNDCEENVIIMLFAFYSATGNYPLFLKDVSPGDGLHGIQEPS